MLVRNILKTFLEPKNLRHWLETAGVSNVFRIQCWQLLSVHILRTLILFAAKSDMIKIKAFNHISNACSYTVI